LRRLFANILENALHVAEKQVDVRCWVEDGKMQVECLDDGPGMTDAQISEFGIKNKNSRLPRKRLQGIFETWLRDHSSLGFEAERRDFREKKNGQSWTGRQGRAFRSSLKKSQKST